MSSEAIQYVLPTKYEDSLHPCLEITGLDSPKGGSCDVVSSEKLLAVVTQSINGLMLPGLASEERHGREPEGDLRPHEPESSTVLRSC
jgi:hypothetical protein